MKLIHCILSITLAGALCSSLLPATADAACAGGSCTPSRGAPARGGGGGHGGGGGGGTDWGGVAAGVGAAIITGIIQQQMLEQNRQPVYEKPTYSRRAQRRSGSGEDTSDDVGDGLKSAVSIDPPLNQYAQVPSDTSDTGSDAGVGPSPISTGSIDSSDEPTTPLQPLYDQRNKLQAEFNALENYINGLKEEHKDEIAMDEILMSAPGTEPKDINIIPLLSSQYMSVVVDPMNEAIKKRNSIAEQLKANDKAQQDLRKKLYGGKSESGGILSFLSGLFSK
jgi:hypothetical protein